MDVDKSLQQLQKQADETLLRDVVFTTEMEWKVREKINRRTRSVWKLSVPVAASLLLGVVIWKGIPAGHDLQPGTPPEAPNMLPGAAWDPPGLWKPSPQQSGVHNNAPFRYFGQKPVRIITDELYEDQVQKVMWLLNGSLAREVELIAVSESGERVALGKWQVADPLYDADGHFPSGIALPTPGIWKLQVLSGGKHFGHVFVEVKPGIMPANRQLVEPLITNYLKTHEEFGWLGDNQRITLDLLGVESPNAETKRVYAWVQILSSEPYKSSGISAPLLFDIVYNGSDYEVILHRMPEDGNRYWSSIEEIFPPDIVKKIKGYRPPSR